ncbi:MAG: flavin reductase [Saprospiraceae bacterium]|nr:flavin reductase [Saprospiraceae bacterium]
MEKRIGSGDIRDMDRFYRMNLINTLSGYKPAMLVGTTGHRGTANLGLFSSIIHISAHPPLLGFHIRQLTVPRHTYHNIRAKGYFTLNHIHSGMLEAAHQASANYAEAVSEFEACGLSPQYSEDHPAPYVLESRIKIGLKYEEEHRIHANGSLLVVGKVVEILASEEALDDSGHWKLQEQDSLAAAGLDTYYKGVLHKRLPYARP